MKKRLLTGVSLVLSLLLTMTACDLNGVVKSVLGGLGSSQTESSEASQPEGITPPKQLLTEWYYSEPGNEKSDQYHLTFYENMKAQLVRQDKVGQTMNLSEGEWKCIDDKTLQLSLHAPDDTTGGVPLYDYQFSLGDKTLTLSCGKGSVAFIPDLEQGPITFYLLQDVLQGLVDPVHPGGSAQPGPSGMDPQKEQALCEAAIKYYAEKNGGYRPGVCMVDSYSKDSVSLHLYDDMGDHIATCARYTVHPDTWVGVDDIMGDPVDFNSAGIIQADFMFMHASYHETTLYLRFDPSNMIGQFMNQNLKTDDPYLVAGVSPNYTRLYFENFAADFRPVLFLLNTEGKVYYVDVLRGGRDLSFQVSGPLPGVNDIVSFESGPIKNDYGDVTTVYAVQNNGNKIDLSEILD